jgi:hypothetical protein
LVLIISCGKPTVTTNATASGQPEAFKIDLMQPHQKVIGNWESGCIEEGKKRIIVVKFNEHGDFFREIKFFNDQPGCNNENVLYSLVNAHQFSVGEVMRENVSELNLFDTTGKALYLSIKFGEDDTLYLSDGESASPEYRNQTFLSSEKLTRK